MKNLFKTCLVVAALTLATSVSARIIPVSLGIKGGPNVSNFNGDLFKSKAGFNAGLTLDISLPANLEIKSGLELTTKGAKLKEVGTSYNAMYIQLPVHLGYRVKLLPGLTGVFDLGPYFAQGIGGKFKDEAGKKHNFFSDSMAKKADWGIGIGAGVDIIGMFGVKVGYDQGFSNIAQADGEKIKNRNAYLSVGYKFF